MSASRTRKAIEEVTGGAQLGTRTSSKGDGTILIPDVLPKKKGWGAFGFTHTGAGGAGVDEYIYLGDSDGMIEAAEFTASTYDSGIGCSTNANLNKQLDNSPVVVDKISIEWGDTVQKGKSIYYAVLQPDGQVEKKDLTPFIRSQKSKNAEQLTVDEAEFGQPLVLDAERCLIFEVGNAKDLEVILHPLVSKR